MRPTTAVALGTHGLAVILSALVWLRARQLEALLRAFGVALPAATEVMIDFHLPAVIFGVLLLSLGGLLALPKTAATVGISSLAVVLGLLAMGLCRWAMLLAL